MSRGLTRAERLREMERLYVQRGFTDIELGERLGVDRITVYKDRLKLESRIPFVKDETGRWRIDKSRYLSEIRVNLHEALALYLATRRMSRQTRVAQPHVAEALSKLSSALRQPMTGRLVQAANTILTQHSRPERIAVMETVTKAWTENRKVEIEYRALDRRHAITHTLHPYLIEPSLWSDSIYAIGYSESMAKIVPFKIERIQTALLRSEKFDTPSDFDEQQLLHHAWGIWYTEQAPVTVRLRFTPGRVTTRVQESIWHPQEQITLLPNGSCEWSAQVAEWQEMLPWIRGWGADVEVLEPEPLRESVKGHLHRAATTYEITSQTAVSPTTRLLRLWGKTSKYTQLFHPALYHMFDVAHIAQQLLSPRATARWRNVLAHTLNADAATLHEWLPYLIALHDIGKLSPPFQILNQKQWERLKSEGFDMGRSGQKQHHTVTGRLLLNEYTAAWPTNLRHAFLDMVSGHHGIYRPEERQDQDNFNFIQEPAEWTALRQHAMQLLESYLCQQWPPELPNPSNVSAAIAALNGFCILCDWLGSDGEYFTPKPATPLPEYMLHSRQKAHKRVQDAGLFQTAVSHAATTFSQLFHDFTDSPRLLQQAIEQIPIECLAQPSLTIIEAPTGEGKTEAALLLARRVAAQRGTDEMYIALPTTATSNAMHQRIKIHLHQRLGLQTNVQLIHGQSFLQEDDIQVNSLVNGENPDEDEAAENWFAPKKKALLAPVGVGTIDQAELSALNVRHNALRLIGLAGKTVILDEVHAYDTYMTTIIKRMLNWLSALGSSVILLSATLPQAKRRELMTAYAPKVDTTAVNLAIYPNIITLTSTHIHIPNDPIAVFQPNKIVQLNTLTFTDEQAQEKADWLLAQVEKGGCICWITNTVNRAQAIFQHLPQDTGLDLTLLHSRFPLAQRQAIETSILAKYGKPSTDINRPQRGIVIGTQVLEQSLDLDFDLMVTDLAPIDLILQRTGRLHRHHRHLADRHYHTSPRLFINMMRQTADQHIYSDYILRMTERTLHNKTSFTLPTDYRQLVEAVYTEIEPDKSDQELYTAWDKLDEQAWELETKANERLADEPIPDYPFYRSAKLQGFSEDEDSTVWAVAQTRWSERETMTLIPLLRHQETSVIPTDPISKNIPLTTKATRKHQLHLLRHSLRVSQPKLVAAIKSEQANGRLPLFQSALLKNAYPLWLTPVPAEPEILINHHLDQPVYLHPQLGLVFGEYLEE